MIISETVKGLVGALWRPVLVGAVALGVIVTLANISYKRGIEEADGLWIKKNGEQVAAFNAKILRIETDSKTVAEKLKEANKKLEDRLDDVLKAGPKIVVRDVKGVPIRCDSQDVYLGKDFSDRWNRLNEEGAMK